MIGIGDAVIAHGLVLSWGPGRHGPGNNVATYHDDPVGATHEHLWDIEQIEDPSWQGKDWAGLTRWRNKWGPGNEDFTHQAVIPPALGEAALVA